MRAVSFAGLHRILHVVGHVQGGLRAKEINDLVLSGKITLTARGSPPRPTTLYHYRNTLIRLGALVRHGHGLVANMDSPDVHALLAQSPPAHGERSLSDAARENFAALVLNNDECRRFFFDLFMPAGKNGQSVSDFVEHALPVRWTRNTNSSGIAKVSFENRTVGRVARHSSTVGISAVLYGLRYWARDELKLVDEYGQGAHGNVVMFPVSNRSPSSVGHESSVLSAVRFLLDARTGDEWTFFSVSDLIVDFCLARRQPRAVLFDAIEWLRRKWPHHIVLIPTSRALATITAMSPQQEVLELRRYYKARRGPYISHMRLHRDVAANLEDAGTRCVQYA